MIAYSDTGTGTADGRVTFYPTIYENLTGSNKIYKVYSSNLPDSKPPPPDPEKIAKAIAEARRRSDALATIGVMDAAKVHARTPSMKVPHPRTRQLNHPTTHPLIQPQALQRTRQRLTQDLTHLPTHRQTNRKRPPRAPSARRRAG